MVIKSVLVELKIGVANEARQVGREVSWAFSSLDEWDEISYSTECDRIAVAMR